MIHEYNSPYSASIDRINSSVGYIIGNVQLVCQAINLAKNKFTNDLMKQFIQDLVKEFEYGRSVKQIEPEQINQ